MAALHVEPNFNPEEAAHAAAEFVSTLDNLPGEVAFLLEEIRDRDERINDLLDRINVRHTSLTKHARTSIQKAEAAAASSSASASTPFPLPIPAGSPFPTSHLSTKEAQAVAKIMGEFDKVQMLQDEKVELAQRMERIVLRAKERGRAEWARVGGKDIVEVEKEEAAASNIGGRASKGGTPGLGAGDGALGVPSGGLGGDRPQKKRKPNLSLGASMPPPPAPVRHPPLSTANSFLSSAHNTPVSSSHGPGARKRDRERERERERERGSVAASDADADGESEDYVSYGSAAGGSASAGAYGITGPMSSHGPGFSAGVHAGHGQGHGGRKGFTVTHPPPANEDVDMDADGEADADGEPDDRLYCICQQKSYGEMIGCDNDECPYEWFHVECVNITGALPKTWYCPDCIKLLGFTGPAHTPSASDTRAGGRTKKGRKSRG